MLNGFLKLIHDHRHLVVVVLVHLQLDPQLINLRLLLPHHAVQSGHLLVLLQQPLLVQETHLGELPQVPGDLRLVGEQVSHGHVAGGDVGHGHVAGGDVSHGHVAGGDVGHGHVAGGVEHGVAQGVIADELLHVDDWFRSRWYGRVS